MFMHSKVLRKVVLENQSRVKNLEDSLKPNCMMKNASLWELGFLARNQTTRLYKEDSLKVTYPKPEWSCTRVYIRMMKNLTLKNRTLEWSSKWFKMLFKDNFITSIWCNKYKRHIRRPKLTTLHFPYVAIHTENTLESEC